MTFKTLGLSERILRAINESGYTSPTPIQARAIPAILDGADIMAAAQTGTGKTAGFTLPLLELLNEASPVKKRRPHALVLTPTRELAAQVNASIVTYGKFLPLRSAAVFGGVGIGPQIAKLNRGVDILVATPGRLLDLHEQNAVRFDDLQVFILDEADRMLDMGFIHDIKKIMAILPKKRQNLMFSATFSDDIRQLAKRFMNQPVEIDVAPRNSTVEAISQLVHPVDKARKPELLAHLIKSGNWYQVLVFGRTKHGADKLVRKLAKNDVTAAAIHGNKSQSQRTRVLSDFKQNKLQVLVATDIASRGIDIDQLEHVINYDLPNVPEDYVHRIGRTGRAGGSGQAVSLVSNDEIKQLRNIEHLIKRAIEREEVDGFEPEIALGTSVTSKSNRKGAEAAKRAVNGKRKRSRPNSQQKQTKRSNAPKNQKSRGKWPSKSKSTKARAQAA